MRINRFTFAMAVLALVGISLHIFGDQGYTFLNRSDDTISAGAPILDCPAVVNVGPVEYGTVIEANFSVANRGGSELVLNEFRSGCTCESIEVKRGDSFVRVGEVRLKPNESAYMRLVMSISERARKSMSSPIYFRTNVPDRPEARLVVDVPVILAGLSAVPRSVTFGEVAVGSDSPHLVQLFDARTVRRRISEVRSSDPERVRAKLLPLKAGVAGLDEAGRGVLVGMLEVTVDTASPGRVSCDVTVYFEEPDVPPETIPVAGRVVAPVEVYPPILHLPRSTSNGFVYSGSCLCRNTSTSGDMALKVTQSPKGVSVKVAEAASGGFWKIQVELTEEYGTPDTPRDLTVKLLATLGERQHEVDIILRIQPGGMK